MTAPADGTRQRAGTNEGMSREEALALAIRFAGVGVPAFPIAISWDPEKQATDKVPLTRNGFYDATTDVAQLRRKFDAATPGSGACLGVGLHLGPRGWMALDVDVKGGARGDEELAALEETHGRLPATPWATTASGGSHVWLDKGDRRVDNTDLVRDQIEVRSDNGYVVAPGVYTPWGRWDFDDATGDVLAGSPVASAPSWIFTILSAGGAGSGNGQAGKNGRACHWREVDPDLLHPADREALEALKRLGGHGEYLSVEQRDGVSGETVRITRPGKHAGTGATIGFSAPGAVKLFTGNWALFEPNAPGPRLRGNATYDADRLLDIATAVEAGDRDEAERLADPLHCSEDRPAAAAASPREDDEDPPEPRWQDRFDLPAPPDEAAYYGLARDVVRLLGPHTEGDPTAILGQFLCAFGNAVGRGPYFQVGGDRHRASLYIGVVGASGKGRKGSGLAVALLPLDEADPGWSSDAKAFGLSTGQGIIHRLRDPQFNAKGDVVDAGARDKRLLAVETEFSRVLRQGAQDGSILSMVLRQGWDGQTLQTMSKGSPERAGDAHLSMVAHTTPADLCRYLDDVDVLNGFANRFAWLASQRSRTLPGGGAITPEVATDLTRRTRKALESARRVGHMTRDAAAETLWEEAYTVLTGERSGALGAVCGRADAQVLRLSMVYALTDGSAVISEAHLLAALALWEYAERSALWIFGWSTGNRQADIVLAELRASYPSSITRDRIRNLLGRNHPVDEPLTILEAQDLATKEIVRDGTRGRPAQYWQANPTPPPVGITAFFSTLKSAQRASGTGNSAFISTPKSVQETPPDGVCTHRDIQKNAENPVRASGGAAAPGSPPGEIDVRDGLSYHPEVIGNCAACGSPCRSIDPDGVPRHPGCRGRAPSEKGHPSAR